MIDSLQQGFIEETTELLSELETTLLAVEDTPTDVDLIAKLFRTLHTIKGSSAMFGFDDIALFTHDIETAYDLIRNGKINVTKHIIDLTLLARDEISRMLTKTGTHTQIEEDSAKKIIESFRELVSEFDISNKNQEVDKVETKSTKMENANDIQQLYYIRFNPGKDLFLTGTNPLMLIDELREMGDLVLSSHFEKIPDFEEINPEECYCYWDILLKTTNSVDNLQDVFIFVSDNSELTFENITNEIPNTTEFDLEELQNIITAYSNNNTPDLLTIIKEYIVKQQHVEQIEIKSSSQQTKQVAKHSETDAVSSIRVSSEKLDELVNLVGELVTIQATLSQVALSNNNTDMISISEEVERITWSLRDSALNIRMLPIGSTFSKFKRLVRDLSNELGKEIELSTDGAETELDKTVIEKLNDPLIHIIRNSIDHGIETPEERLNSGKSSIGSVNLSASQSGGSVLIKIEDDGAGLDKEVIMQKAIKSGIISETAELSDSEIYSLIFAAGFSTAKTVTSVSGRGVGMDVVKRAIEGLRGTVQVSSEKGKGTVITLKLPLTLAIIDGLLVKVEDDHYVLPLSSVEECIELTQDDIDKVHGRHIVNVRGGIVPYISLRERFEITTERPKIEQIVIATINNHVVGFVVDQVFGQHQTVLKSLGKYYENVEGVSGATILGDGTVALILDINKIMEREELLENTFNNSRLK
jgi:two-component system, chemotaxis family, sensor kinase CheA